MGRLRVEYSQADREMILDRALQPYLAKGWEVDDRFACSAVISKELGLGYLVAGLRGNPLSKDREGRPAGRLFKRRDVRVDEFGDVRVKRAPTREEGVSRYQT
jgi:hypothetical protein